MAGKKVYYFNSDDGGRTWVETTAPYADLEYALTDEEHAAFTRAVAAYEDWCSQLEYAYRTRTEKEWLNT